MVMGWFLYLMAGTKYCKLETGIWANACGKSLATWIDWTTSKKGLGLHFAAFNFYRLRRKV
jgi:hypothetical protein